MNYFRISRISTVFIAIGFLLFTGCYKENEIAKEDNLLQKEVNELQLNIHAKVSNGLLTFENFEAFQNAMEFISDSEKRHFTDEALNEWENKIGFQSMRSEFDAINTEFEKIEDKESLNIFQQKYSKYLKEEDIQLPVSNMLLASLIDRKGKVIIGKALHCFTDKSQIIILDKDEEKLEIALRLMTTNEDAGVFVHNYIYEDLDLRGNCGKVRNCEEKSNGNSNGSKRIKGKWQLQLYASPQWDWSCYCYTSWNYTVDYYCEMLSHKKKIFGWKKNKKDHIEWGTGYGVQSDLGSTSSGTHWTEKSWKITYLKRLFPIRSITFGSGFPNPSFFFTYNNTTLKNVNDHFQCEDDCF